MAAISEVQASLVMCGLLMWCMCLQVKVVDADNGVLASGVDLLTFADITTSFTKLR